MGRKAIDNKKSSTWGLLSMVGGGAAVSFSRLELLNVDTGRAHQLSVGAIGAAVGAGGAATTDYTYFKTKRPVNFSDFNGITVEQLGVNLGAYNFCSFEMYRILLLPIARVIVHGWGPGFGFTATKGYAKVSYGNGNPIGKKPRIRIPSPKLDFEKIQRFVPYETKPAAKPRFILPDALFAFNSDKLTEANPQMLTAAGFLLHMRLKPGVTIEGHTDSKGPEDYNLRLSLRRAEAVKRWFCDHGVKGAASFKTVGYGEKYPVAPNTLPNGADNPLGRQKNRRVEIVAYLRK